MANPNNEAGVDRLVADARARDKSNQSVIDEFRANGGKVGGDLEGVPVLLLTMTGTKTGRTLIRPLRVTAIAWSSSLLTEALRIILRGTTICSQIRW